jgi:hypothetical protein
LSLLVVELVQWSKQAAMVVEVEDLVVGLMWLYIVQGWIDNPYHNDLWLFHTIRNVSSIVQTGIGQA